MGVGAGLQHLNRAPNLEGRRRGRHRLAKTHRDGIGNRARQFPDEPPALEAEDTAPHTVEVYGNDRRVHALHDALHAAAERQQLADARDLSLGKDADDFAILDRIGGFAQGLEHFARPKLGGNRNGANHFRKRLYIGKIVNALEHQEAD